MFLQKAVQSLSVSQLKYVIIGQPGHLCQHVIVHRGWVRVLVLQMFLLAQLANVTNVHLLHRWGLGWAHTCETAQLPIWPFGKE